MINNTESKNSPNELLHSQQVFPWGIELCTLIHPKNGRRMAGILPSNSGGFVVLYERNREYEAEQLIECAVLEMLDKVTMGNMDIHVLDFNIRNRYPNLSELKPLNLYNIYHSEKSALNLINQVEEKSVYRHHNVLSDDVKTVSDYNKSSNFPEKYSIIIINVDDFPSETTSIAKLRKILESCFDAGFYVIFLSSLDSIISNNDEKISFLKNIQNSYPTVLLNKESSKKKIKFVKHDLHTKELLDVCQEFSLITEYPAEIDLKIDELVTQSFVRAKKGASKLHNFLSIPIGTTLDGRHEITFDMGQRSGNVHSLILGGTGTGKTTFLNNIIVQIAEKYTSSEIRLYLMDYKNGTEFQIFNNHPNCEKIFLDNSDFEAAKDLIIQFSNLITERAPLFRNNVVSNIDEYNEKNPDNKLFRVILIIDEIQKLFSSPEGSNLQKHLQIVAEQGRSFGIHFIFATQSLANYTLDAALMEQMQLRAAFPISPRDCTRLFGYNNTVASELKNFHVLINNNRSGSMDENIICRCNPPVEISRITHVINNLDPKLRLKPIVCVSKESGIEPLIQKRDEKPTTEISIPGLNMEALENVAKEEEKTYSQE